MWSNLYWYFNIRSDRSLSGYLPSSVIVTLLKKQNEIKQTGPQSFTNNADFPWIEISCVDSKNGSYTHNYGDSTEKSNLIVVAASRRNSNDYERYTRLLTGVANKLDWELTLEEDDNGNEDIVINK